MPIPKTKDPKEKVHCLHILRNGSWLFNLLMSDIKQKISIVKDAIKR